MSWEERDWAAWSDEERARHPAPAAASSSRYRPSGAFIVALVLLALSGGLGLTLVPSAPKAAPSAPPSPIVYGSGLAGPPGERWTCTAIGDGPDGSGSCVSWAVLLPGQRAVEAAKLPAGVVCRAAEVDQHTGSWVCIGGGASA